MAVEKHAAAMTVPTKGPFHVIKNEYIGFDDDLEEVLQEQWIISTEPGRANLSQEPVIKGWLGSSGDWSSDAHGEFPTIDEARDYIAKRVDRLISVDDDEDHDEGVVEAYRAHIETIVVAVRNWWGSCDAFHFGITAETTDEEIVEIAEAEIAAARQEIEREGDGIPAFEGDLEDLITDLRDKLREKVESGEGD